MPSHSIRKKLLTGVAALAIGLGAASANAALLGVSSILISNAGVPDGWLQVAEFEAYQLGTGTNAALAATASAPDSWNAFSTPDKAIDGNTDGNFFNQSVFHEGNPRTGDTLTITLAAVTDLSGFAIYGRTDCCSARDVYNIDFLDAAGATLFSATDVDATAGSDHVARFQFPSQQVPAPGVLALFGLGALLLGARTALRRARLSA